MFYLSMPFKRTYEYVFVISLVYLDDLDIHRTPRKLSKAFEYMEEKFRMKDSGRTKLCLRL